MYTIITNACDDILEFIINDEYIVFEYYDFNEEGDRIFDLPSVDIIKRDYKKLYFITEMYQDFLIYEKYSELDNDIAYGSHFYRFYNILDDEVKYYNFEEIELTNDMFVCLSCGADINNENVEEYVESKFKVKK